MIVFKDHNLMLSIVVIQKTNLSVIFFGIFSLFFIRKYIILRDMELTKTIVWETASGKMTKAACEIEEWNTCFIFYV